MENTNNSESSVSSGPNETVTIIYAEMKAARPVGPERSSTSTSYSSDTSSSTSSSEALPTFNEVNLMKVMEERVGYIPVKLTMSTTKGPKMRALDYFKAHHMFPLFTFLMSHLLAHSPEEPVQFLIALVNRCLKYRDHDADPPLLFEDCHVRSVYTALDPMDNGSIKYEQYVNGMVTMGLAHFNDLPEGVTTRIVPKDVFICEAKEALLKQLDILVGKTRRRISNYSDKSDLTDNSEESLTPTSSKTNNASLSAQENLSEKEETFRSSSSDLRKVLTIHRQSSVSQN